MESSSCRHGWASARNPPPPSPSQAEPLPLQVGRRCDSVVMVNGDGPALGPDWHAAACLQRADAVTDVSRSDATRTGPAGCAGCWSDGRIRMATWTLLPPCWHMRQGSLMIGIRLGRMRDTRETEERRGRRSHVAPPPVRRGRNAPPRGGREKRLAEPRFSSSELGWERSLQVRTGLSHGRSHLL